MNLFFGVVRVTMGDSLFANLVRGFGHLYGHSDFLFTGERTQEFRVVTLGLWARIVRNWHVSNGTCLGESVDPSRVEIDVVTR